MTSPLVIPIEPANATALTAGDFLSFTKFVALLPGAMPRASLTLLQEAVLFAAESDAAVHVQNSVVSINELNELFHRDASGSSNLVSPAGAKVLIRLYEAGSLSTKTKALGPVPPEALAYANSKLDLAQKTRERALEAAARKDASKAGVLAEADFTWSRLNDVFWAMMQAGTGSMTLGGVVVTKHLLRRTSNSGKSSDFEVTFSWASAQGEGKSLTKESLFAGNRRNDEARNHGLPS